MAEIRRFLFVRHARIESSRHALVYRRGRLVAQGRGLAFWFRPLTTGIAEVPVDDREATYLIHGRSRDFQDVLVQGAVEYRVVDAAALAGRVDFTIDHGSGNYREKPLERIAGLLTDLGQQIVVAHLARRTLRELLDSGLAELRTFLEDGLRANETLKEMGLVVLGVRVKDVSPEPEVARALQTKEREAIQQEADQATFQRRALAVEKERAIEENELQNKIELARREEQLIAQKGENARRAARDEADAKQIAAEAAAKRAELEHLSQAAAIRDVESARNDSERERTSIYGALPVAHVYALAAQNFAKSLQRIEHLNVTPELVASLLQQFQIGPRTDAAPTAKPPKA
jgi:regulator of protease activity HflC (stomatin/prohibitin superfamily)